jgi:copper-containing nitrite reductase
MFTRFSRRFGAAVVATGAGFVGVSYLNQSYNQPLLAAAAMDAKTPGRKVPDVHAALPLEVAVLVKAPDVPPPITRKHPVLLIVNLTFDAVTGYVTRSLKYDFWSINGSVPGPLIRCREGDVIEVNVTNNDNSGMPHNLDFHAVMGPGGGASLLNAEEGRTKSAHFKMTTPGLFIYHCAAAPVPMHIAQGMYGMILVEPKDGLAPVDKEYYVMQSEFYLDEPEKGSNVAAIAYDKGLREDADAVVFNGREGSLTDKGVLKSNVGDRVRLFFGNAGPNLISSFHVIGTVFDKVFREGDLISPPGRGIQTTLVAPGSSTVVEFQTNVPGNLTLIDHAIFRLDKGAVGFLMVKGEKNDELYHSHDIPNACYGCKLHP